MDASALIEYTNQVSSLYLQNLDVITSKQPILIVRFLLNAEWTNLGENSFASNSFTVGNFFKIVSQFHERYKHGIRCYYYHAIIILSFILPNSMEWNAWRLESLDSRHHRAHNTRPPFYNLFVVLTFRATTLRFYRSRGPFSLYLKLLNRLFIETCKRKTDSRLY